MKSVENILDYIWEAVSKKISLTTRNVRLDSGRYATKYYFWFFDFIFFTWMLPQSALLPPLGHRKTIPLAIFENWCTAEKWQHDCPTKQLFDLTTTITDSWGCAWQQGWWSLNICQIRMFTSFMIFLQVTMWSLMSYIPLLKTLSLRLASTI